MEKELRTFSGVVTTLTNTLANRMCRHITDIIKLIMMAQAVYVGKGSINPGPLNYSNNCKTVNFEEML